MLSERLIIEKKSIVQVLQEAGYEELTYRMHYLRFADKIQSKYLYFMDMMTVNKTHGKKHKPQCKLWTAQQPKQVKPNACLMKATLICESATPLQWLWWSFHLNNLYVHKNIAIVREIDVEKYWVTFQWAFVSSLQHFGNLLSEY